jgi:alpha-galactosidase
MGWNSWNKFAGDATSTTRPVRGMADAMVSSGMKDAGLRLRQHRRHLGRRTRRQRQHHHATKVSGHEGAGRLRSQQRLKLGIYSSPGPEDLRGLRRQLRPRRAGREDLGGMGHRLSEVRLVRRERNIYKDEDMHAVYQKMGDALRHRPRRSLQPLPVRPGGCVEVGSEVSGNLWRTTGDIRDNWDP